MVPFVFYEENVTPQRVFKTRVLIDKENRVYRNSLEGNDEGLKTKNHSEKEERWGKIRLKSQTG